MYTTDMIHDEQEIELKGLLLFEIHIHTPVFKNVVHLQNAKW